MQFSPNCRRSWRGALRLLLPVALHPCSVNKGNKLTDSHRVNSGDFGLSLGFYEEAGTVCLLVGKKKISQHCKLQPQNILKLQIKILWKFYNRTGVPCLISLTKHPTHKPMFGANEMSHQVKVTCYTSLPSQLLSL